ncbi:hypothetical protein [Microbacterium sp.]
MPIALNGRTTRLGGVALLVAGAVALAGCSSAEAPEDETSAAPEESTASE